jgi:hypothetical protein
MLTSRPTRNDSLKWEETEEGEIRIKIKRDNSWKIRFLSKLFYIPKNRKITLDEVGSEVWQLCNGRNSVGDMIEKLSVKYQLNRKEAEISLLQYLKTLGEKRFIGFVMRDEKGKTDPGVASGKKWTN